MAPWLTRALPPSRLPGPLAGKMILMAKERYRCADCLHGAHLTAWVIVLAHGPLGPDGKLAEVDYDEEDVLYEDSIACTEHPDSVIEQSVDGVWCHWWACFLCGGEPRGWGDLPCRGPSPAALKGAHRGWCPISEVPPLVWPGLGTGHELDQDLRFYKPGSPTPCCRICGLPAGSGAGREPCAGVWVLGMLPDERRPLTRAKTV